MNRCTISMLGYIGISLDRSPMTILVDRSPMTILVVIVVIVVIISENACAKLQ